MTSLKKNKGENSRNTEIITSLNKINYHKVQDIINYCITEQEYEKNQEIVIYYVTEQELT